jgi:hypothetical protein
MIGALSLFLSAPIAAQESFYKGKTLTFLVGAPPGGGFDTMTRIVARHMGRHLPGNPSWQGLKSSWRRQYEAGDVAIIVQTNRKSIPELTHVPLALITRNPKKRSG